MIAAGGTSADPLAPLVGLLAEVDRTGDGAARARLVADWAALRGTLSPDALAGPDAARLDLAAVRADLLAVPWDADPSPALRERLAAARDAARDAGLPVVALLADLELFGIDAVERARTGPDALAADLAHVARVTAAAAAEADAHDPQPDLARARAMSRAARVVLAVARAVPDEEAAAGPLVAAAQAADEAVRAFEALGTGTLAPGAAADYGRALSVALLAEEDDEAATGRLEEALGLLPAGTRAADRGALLQDLAGRRLGLGDADGAVAALDEASGEFARAGRTERSGVCAALAGSVLGRLDRHDEAADRLGRAVAASAGARPGAPSTVDFGLHADHLLALRRAGRTEEGAAAAADVVRLLDEQPPSGEPAHAFQAGRAAYAAALAVAATGDAQGTAALALRSADLHAGHDDVLARAEALDLAASSTADPADAATLLEQAVGLADGVDAPWQAAELRRRWAAATAVAQGPDAALAILDDARARIAGLVDPAQPLQGRQVALVDHQRGAALVAAGRAPEAVEALADVAQAYGDAGDHDSAVSAICLQVEALHLAGRTADAVAVGRGVAGQLAAAGGVAHAGAVAGILAAVLEDSGDAQGAREVWAQYGPTDGNDPAGTDGAVAEDGADGGSAPSA